MDKGASCKMGTVATVGFVRRLFPYLICFLNARVLG